MNTLRRITEGISGQEAADIIYQNDSGLYEEISECKTSIEAIKKYGGGTASGSTVNIDITSVSGTSETKVMSQKGVTDQVILLREEMKNMVVTSTVEIDDNTHDVPDTSVVNATYATKAAYDMQGHELSSFYQQIVNLQNKITELETRIEELEN